MFHPIVTPFRTEWAYLHPNEHPEIELRLGKTVHDAGGRRFSPGVSPMYFTCVLDALTRRAAKVLRVQRDIITYYKEYSARYESKHNRWVHKVRHSTRDFPTNGVDSCVRWAYSTECVVEKPAGINSFSLGAIAFMRARQRRSFYFMEFLGWRVDMTRIVMYQPQRIDEGQGPAWSLREIDVIYEIELEWQNPPTAHMATSGEALLAFITAVTSKLWASSDYQMQLVRAASRPSTPVSPLS